MYIAYRIETYDGIDYMQPVGVFRNKKDMNDLEKYNKVYVINGYLKITKVLKDGEDDKVVFEKLKKLSPKLLLKKEIDELKNSDENGFRANSLFVQIDAIDLLNNI